MPTNSRAERILRRINELVTSGAVGGFRSGPMGVMSPFKQDDEEEDQDMSVLFGGKTNKNRPTESKRRMIREARDVDADDIVMWIDNSREIYDKHTVPGMKSLVSKIVSGGYDSGKALEVFKRIVNVSLPKFVKDSDYDFDYRDVDKEKIDAAAQDLLHTFEIETGLGNFDKFIPSGSSKKTLKGWNPD